MTTNGLRILLIQQEGRLRRLLEELLLEEIQELDHLVPTIVAVGSADEGQGILEGKNVGPFHLIIAGEEPNGEISLSAEMQSGHLGIPVIIMSGGYMELAANRIDQLVAAKICSIAVNTNIDIRILANLVLQHARRPS